MSWRDLFRRRRKRKPSAVWRRAFQAATVSRLTADWTTVSRAPEAELRYALKALRARARDLAQNNDYARRFLQLVTTNVVGPHGVKLQVRARDDNGRLDAFANQVIEDWWRRWGVPGSCTVCGRLSWTDAQRLIVESVARDGEVLVRLLRGRAARNEIGFALQILEADYLDEQLNRKLAGGRKIVMSVEVDGWGRPVAYHLLNEHPGAETVSIGGRRYTRVPAGEVLHLYLPERPDQPRGVPWMCSAMLRLQMLGGYEEAELVAARVAAAKMGFLVSPDADSYVGAGEEAEGAITMDAEPGVFEQLPAGLRVETFDPDHPNAQFEAFVKAALRGVASGLGVSYVSLANDLEGVNYSSIRAGSLEERDRWRVLQRWLIEHLCRPVYEQFLLALLTSGVTTLPPRKFAKFNAPVWSPRGWQWVDPLKEVQANMAAVAAGFRSRAEVAAEQGRDLEEIFDALAAEKELAAAKGIDLATPRWAMGDAQAGGGDGAAQG